MPRGVIRPNGAGRVDRPAFSEVIVRQAASPTLSPKEKADYDDFIQQSDLQNRYEGMDRGINFPVRNY